MGVQKVFIPSTHVYSERIIYISSQESNVDGVTLIYFSAPIIIGTALSLYLLRQMSKTHSTLALQKMPWCIL